jgi:hypothetical protein
MVPLDEYLRIKNMLANQEEALFDLKASILTIEAEAKLEAQKGIKMMTSELNFKVRIIVSPSHIVLLLYFVLYCRRNYCYY